MTKTLDLKSTLNLPKTDFSMKANLPVNEPKRLVKWEELGLYHRIREARAGSPLYVLHDGPPYANGAIHEGHALNRSLKDFVVKSKTMAGFDSPFVPGWDCHGLPIEIKVDKSLGREKLEMAPLAVRRACREYAQKYVNLQRTQFIRLGCLARYEEPYLTMSPQYESVIAATFFQFFENGFVYKGLRPVYWCIHDKTALAEAEVEYADHTSPSVWVKYVLTSDPAALDAALAGKKVSTIIWTTTPWTLPASMAVAFHPEFEYVAVESGNEVHIVADQLAASTIEICGLRDAKVIARIPGRKLEYSTFAHPFLDRKILGVLADYITADQGTGAVHTAPSHGADDFYTGVKYKLEQTCNVDEAGRLHNGLAEYDGLAVFKANEPIVELLERRGVLLASRRIQHSYPHCWRCHNPVIFRATEQWFISMETPVDGGTLRSKALDAIRKVRWDPAWGEERISNMIATRPDWCISRQRVWGVPIPIFFCPKPGCGGALHSKSVNQRVVELFASKGADAWYELEPATFLPAGTACPKCKDTEFRKEMDIIDVWFESGSSQAAVLGREPGLPWPADMYLEGGDQYRGWFHSSLLCAVGTRGQAPYRMVMTHGWTLDAQGQAMSKSLGNGVDPVEIANRLGAEIIRLWAASVDFREDINASEELMRKVAENYKKIRNTFKNALGNLYDFDPHQHQVSPADMVPLDRYLVLLTADLAAEIAAWYEEFAFHKIYQRINQFCVVDLSAFYFDVLKDRLYTSSPNSLGRRSAQTALWRIAEVLARLLAPIMSFTADEVWEFLPNPNKTESVHLSLFPKKEEVLGRNFGDMEHLRSDWGALLGLREAVLKSLEEARQTKLIGSSLEAQVRIAASNPVYEVAERYHDHLRELLIVSRVELEQTPSSNGAAPISVKTTQAPGQKCERCWTYSVHVGEDPAFPTVCERCSRVLGEITGAKGA